MENHSNINNQFIPYNSALELKKLGFGEPCFGFYDTDGYWYLQYCRNGNIFKINNGALSPTFSQAFRFFREKYGLHYIICKNIQMDGYGYREVILIPHMEENENTIFKTYEESEVGCLKKLIEIAKEQNVK